MKKILLALVLFCNLPIALASSTTISNTNEQTLNYGVVSYKAKKRIRDSSPFANTLATQLSEFGYKSAKVHVFNNTHDLISALQQGHIDVISSTVYSALLYQQEANTQPIAVRWKKALSSYQSLFVTKADSSINSFSDLENKVIAFESRESTSGYFLPMITLLNHGHQLERLNSTTSKPQQGNIGYVILDDLLHEANEITMSMWAAMGVVDAIAFSSTNWENEKDTPKNIQKLLRIFDETEYYPRALISVSPNLSNPVIHKIQEVLFDFDTHSENKETLSLYQNTTKFSPIDQDAHEIMSKAASQLHKIDIADK